MDSAGIAAIISSLAALLTAAGGIFMAISLRRGQKELHDSVDGQSEQLKTLIKTSAFAEGKEAGQDKERAVHAAAPAVDTPAPVIIEALAPAAMEAVKDSIAQAATQVIAPAERKPPNPKT